MENASNDMNKDINYLLNQLNIARSEINNLRHQVKSFNYVHHKECDEIRNTLENFSCLKCRNGGNNIQGPSVSDNSDLSLRYIGVIRTQFPEKRATPRQPLICPELVAKLVLNNDVLTNPQHALEGLEEYSHMWIIFHFHRNDSTHVRSKVAPPRLNGLRTGVFATRSPHRPCPIGMSLVKIDRIMENVVYFSGVDMVDGTPVLDIKPYIPHYDNPAFDQNEEINLELSSEVAVDNVSRVMDGDENGSRVGANDGDSAANSSIEESFYTRSTSRMGEREAPDGEEDEEPQQASNAAINNGNISVPSWIDQPRVQQLSVLFKDSALTQLNLLGAAESEEKLKTINSILKEDPRSVYLRSRSGNNCYVFRIASLYVSCKFNDVEHSVTVFKISQVADVAD